MRHSSFVIRLESSSTLDLRFVELLSLISLSLSLSLSPCTPTRRSESRPFSGENDIAPVWKSLNFNAGEREFYGRLDSSRLSTSRESFSPQIFQIANERTDSRNARQPASRDSRSVWIDDDHPSSADKTNVVGTTTGCLSRRMIERGKVHYQSRELTLKPESVSSPVS